MSFIVYGAPAGGSVRSELLIAQRLFWRTTLRRFGLYAGLALGLVMAIAVAVALAPTPGESQARTVQEPLPKNPWIEINRPFQLYALASPDFGRDPAFEAQRHRDGGGRVDTLVWNKIGEETPYLRLAIHRVGREPVEDSAFFVQMVRQAAGFGAAVTRGGVADTLKTRFGNFETADVMLETGGASAACLGFRFAQAGPALRMSGFACGAAAKPMDRRTLACALDRLDLVSAGEDRDLSRFFAASEPARDPRCAPSRNAQPGVQANANWIDQAGAAPLRGVAAKPRGR